MKRGLALGIDVGTSGVRCALLDATGEMVLIAGAPMGGGDADRRDPALWAKTLGRALEILSSQIDLKAIGAISVDGTSGTVLGLDAKGAPVGSALMYNDPVDDPAILDPIKAAAPRESAAHGANSALARACMLQQRPGVVRIAHQADWIAEQLVGKPLASDESNALKTGYDPIARRWPDWLAETPINRALLPEVVPCGERTGATKRAFGLRRGVPLVAGFTDGCAAFFATGADEIGAGVTSLGTTLTLKLLSDKPVFAPEAGVYSHRVGDLWLAGGASNSGGGALEAFFKPTRIADLSARIDPERDSGLDYYPLPRPGERFPVNDPMLEPRVSPRPTKDAAFLHGLLEGVAKIEALGYRRLAEFGAPALKSLRSVGSGAENPTWTAIRRRLIDVPFVEADTSAAAAGAGRLALAWMERGS